VTDDDPNEAYEVVPIELGPHGPPKGWWTVTYRLFAIACHGSRDVRPL
jgi:hypothetical protein